MTAEDRKSPENGIWLCELCAKKIDKAPDAFPVETLAAWKRFGETAAVRDAWMTSDEIVDLTDEIDRVIVDTVNFCWNCRHNDPHTFMRRSEMIDQDLRQEFEDYVAHTHEMKAIYNAEITPQTTDITARCETNLGVENYWVQKLREAKSSVDFIPANTIAQDYMIIALQELKTALQLR